MRIRTRGLWLCVALLAAACGARTAGGNRSSDTITRQQMIDVAATTVYDAVQKLQPSWFSTRGPRSLTDETPTVASVFVNGSNVGDITYLRNLRPDDVDRRYRAELVPFELRVTTEAGGRATALLDMTRFSSWAREDEPARIVFGADRRPESITASLILGTSLTIRIAPAPVAAS